MEKGSETDGHVNNMTGKNHKGGALQYWASTMGASVRFYLVSGPGSAGNDGNFVLAHDTPLRRRLFQRTGYSHEVSGTDVMTTPYFVCLVSPNIPTYSGILSNFLEFITVRRTCFNPNPTP